MAKRAKKFTDNDKRMMLWCLSERNNAEDAYRKAQRNYCLYKGTWEEVQDCRRRAHYFGISDETLVEIDIEVMNSITDEELYEVVYG